MRKMLQLARERGGKTLIRKLIVFASCRLRADCSFVVLTIFACHSVRRRRAFRVHFCEKAAICIAIGLLPFFAARCRQPPAGASCCSLNAASLAALRLALLRSWRAAER